MSYVLENIVSCVPENIFHTSLGNTISYVNSGYILGFF